MSCALLSGAFIAMRVVPVGVEASWHPQSQKVFTKEHAAQNWSA